jgi:hypothetical protein
MTAALRTGESGQKKRKKLPRNEDSYMKENPLS